MSHHTRFGDTPAQMRSSTLYDQGYELDVASSSSVSTLHALVNTNGGALSSTAETLWSHVSHATKRSAIHDISSRLDERVDVRIMRCDSVELAVLCLFSPPYLLPPSTPAMLRLDHYPHNHVLKLMALIPDPVDATQFLVVTSAVKPVSSFEALQDLLAYIRKLLEVSSPSGV